MRLSDLFKDVLQRFELSVGNAGGAGEATEGAVNQGNAALGLSGYIGDLFGTLGQSNGQSLDGTVVNGVNDLA